MNNKNWRDLHEFKLDRDNLCECGLSKDEGIHTMNETKKDCCPECAHRTGNFAGMCVYANCPCHEVTPNNSLEGKEPRCNTCNLTFKKDERTTTCSWVSGFYHADCLPNEGKEANYLEVGPDILCLKCNQRIKREEFVKHYYAHTEEAREHTAFTSGAVEVVSDLEWKEPAKDFNYSDFKKPKPDTSLEWKEPVPHEWLRSTGREWRTCTVCGAQPDAPWHRSVTEPAKEWRDRLYDEFDFFECSALQLTKLETFIAELLEQALARGRRELEKEYTHGYNVIKTGEHIYIHSRVVEAEKNQAFEAGKKEARTKNWEDYALGFGEGRAARDSELRVLIKARIVQTPMDTQSRMLQGKNEAFEDMLELLTKDTKSETQ